MVKKNKFTLFLEDELSIRGWSRADFSRMSGISQAHLTRILNGSYQPGLNSYSGIAKGLNIPLEIILRKAGILPEAEKSNADFVIMKDLFNKLDKQNQEIITQIARLLNNYNKNQPST